MKLALFDFDETLTQQNSLWCLFQIAVKAKPQLLMDMSIRSALLPVYRKRLERDLDWKVRSWGSHSKRAFRQQLYVALSRNFMKSDVYDMGRLAAQQLQFNEVVIEQLMELESAGHESWVVTGSLEPFVEGVIDQISWPVTRIVGTQWEPEAIRAPHFKECLRHEKVRRIQSILDCMPTTHRSTVAYGNLPDDGPMLALAEKSFSVSRGKPSLINQTKTKRT